MKNILGILLATIFAILGLFHIVWALDGRIGGTNTIPSNNGVAIFKPSIPATLAVSLALFLAMMTILVQIGFFGEMIPNWISRRATFGIAALFFLRAIGEFKYVGFFKKASDSGFSYWDTVLFSPLCLFIAVAAFLISYQK
jgi:hypothetical protein